MDRIPAPYRTSAHKLGAVSRILVTLFSLTTIALLIFAGSRDWKSGKSVSAILSDTSDIRSLVAHLAPTKATEAKADHSIVQPKEQASLISHGMLLRQEGAKSLPAGMETAAAY